MQLEVVNLDALLYIQSKVRGYISQDFVAFSEYMNFTFETFNNFLTKLGTNQL